MPDHDREERERCPCVQHEAVPYQSDQEGWDWLSLFAAPLCPRCGGFGWITVDNTPRARDTIVFVHTGPTIVRLFHKRDGNTVRSVGFPIEKASRIRALLLALGWIESSWCDLEKSGLLDPRNMIVKNRP